MINKSIVVFSYSYKRIESQNVTYIRIRNSVKSNQI